MQVIRGRKSGAGHRVLRPRFEKAGVKFRAHARPRQRPAPFANCRHGTGTRSPVRRDVKGITAFSPLDCRGEQGRAASVLSVQAALTGWPPGLVIPFKVAPRYYGHKRDNRQ